MEFVGAYYHTIEERGRVSIPKQFRSGLKKGSIITKGLDGCLFIFPAEYWKKLSTKLQSLPLGQKTARDFLRLMTYHASPIQFDNIGRTRFPVPLADSINLKKEIVFVGVLTRIEVWNKRAYHSYFDKLAERESELSESIGELGI